MPRKLTFDEVKEEFRRRGFVLLDKEYKNATTKMRYRCPKHPDENLKMNVHSLKKGYGCPYCSGNRKPTYPEVRLEFERRGYTLLETEYKNNHTRMRYRCPYHPDENTRISLKDLRNGHGCPFCAGLNKTTLEEAKKEFESRGYLLLEKEFKNARTKMKYQCSKHKDKILSITLNKLKLGRGCPYCAVEKRANMTRGSKHHNWKGGVTLVKDFLRNSDILKDWKSQALEQHGFKCYVTGEYTKKLEVHHPIPFHIMRDRALQRAGLKLGQCIGDYTQEELERLLAEFGKIHNQYKGIPMKREVHKLFHKFYGFETTMRDLDEFKQQYSL